ncbi:MAG: hypothetical protein JWM89_3129, partial [Acidimicrobiales bacterium]|nr:hypothetical protein [Acidimicrobiales bacterium]
MNDNQASPPFRSQLRTRLVTTVTAVAGTVILGAVAIAAAGAISNTPSPTKVVDSRPATLSKPVSSSSLAKRRAKHRKPAVAPTTPTTAPKVSDDPAAHDLGDDHGGTRPAGTTDDPAGHDVGDDHGGT